ncbi:MAG: hypothetical protein JWQ68_89 [Cryobacterium sp.]|nr:hypothetical protein [Cryobacterium sp.]
MKLRLLTALVAVILAAIGAFLVNGYVSAADARAYAGAETFDVLVVTKAVPEGTPVEEMAKSLQVRSLPRSALAAGVLADLAGTTGRVAAIELQPGEQLLESRLVDPASLQPPGTVPLPEGMQEVTIQLGPDRVVGGRVAAGDTVGFFVTIAADEATAPATHLLFHKVLVTSIQGAPVAAAEGESSEAPPVPAGSMLVTLALNAVDSQKVIFAAENGSIWLSNAPQDADETGPTSVSTKELFQ